MDNEPYRVLGHHEAADLVATMLSENNYKTWREHRLPSGKKPDVFALKHDGMIEIYEVKTELKASLIESTREKYAHFCHRLYIVVPNATYQMLGAFTDRNCWNSRRDEVGLMGVVRDAIYQLRAPRTRVLDQRIRDFLTEKLPKPWSVGETGGHGPLVPPEAR